MSFMLKNNETLQNTEIKNKGFFLLDQIFTENGWKLVKNQLDNISYTKNGNELDYFEIKINPNNITVSIPIKNSPFQFCTSFKDYFQTSEYLENRFLDFIE